MFMTEQFLNKVRSNVVTQCTIFIDVDVVASIIIVLWKFAAKEIFPSTYF